MIFRRRFRQAGAAAGVVLAVALSGCGGESRHPAGSESGASNSTADSVRLPAEECDSAPPQGPIDRAGHGLQFGNGSIWVSIDSGDDAQAGCYRFSKSGPADAGVPPDSLLFVFTGVGTDGAQVEFGVSELAGGRLPPVPGTRPRVGPLEGPIAAQIGISLGGVYHHSAACRLALSAMSSAGAAGSFDCPEAVQSQANPFNPSDDVPYDVPTDDHTPDQPPTTVALHGWFELAP